ncbi:MAG: tryptophan synthase subunit alpha [Gemmatimonadales bacterium]
MSEHRLAARWRALRAAGRPGLVAYLTAGYPSGDATVSALRMLDAEGVDVIELGLPFSDPVADGPVIQRSSHQALGTGASVAAAFDQLRRAAPQAPVIAFSYLNPILAYGVERFVTDAAAVGIVGLLVTDLPTGADPALEARLASGPLALVRLVAPTTSPDRLRTMTFDPRGFVYVIARLGVTGARSEVADELASVIGRVREVTDLPIAVGFGIRDVAQARRVAGMADGVVVGTALVECLGESEASARSLIRALREALHQVPAPVGRSG